MPIAFTNITKVGSQSWRFEWAATTSPYRVYWNGTLLDTVTALEYIIEENGYLTEPPALEVLDANDTDDAENIAYPPRLVIQWRQVSDVLSYGVREKVGATWTARATVGENNLGYYRHETPALDDITTADWRVVAIDSLGNESDPLEFDAFVVRNPDPPDITITYDPVNEELDVAAA